MRLLTDLRYAARRLASDWRFTLAAAFTLSLGIGANATAYDRRHAKYFTEQSHP